MDVPEGWFFSILGVLVTVIGCSIIGGVIFVLLAFTGVL